MFRSFSTRLCATSAQSPVGKTTIQNTFESWLLQNKARFADNVVLKHNAQGRGITAKRKFRPGMPVVSMPLAGTINADRLMKLPHIKARKVPTFEEVRSTMMTASVNDPILMKQWHLALLVAADFSSAETTYGPYYASLPIPAINDAEVMSLHKGILEAPQLIEWDDHQRMFTGLLRKLLSRWENHPPEQVVYWAWRTVLCRQQMMPDMELTAEESKVNFGTLFTLRCTDTTLAHRMKLLGERISGELTEFDLVPTLVPCLDMVSHNSVVNVCVEVQERPEGTCAELQAITDIAEGEDIGLCFSRAHSVPMTLYRFGFLPV